MSNEERIKLLERIQFMQESFLKLTDQVGQLANAVGRLTDLIITIKAKNNLK